jgi:hypothetical protein
MRKEIEKLDDKFTEWGCDDVNTENVYQTLHRRDRKLLELVKGEIKKEREYDKYHPERQLGMNIALSVLDNFIKEVSG